MKTKLHLLVCITALSVLPLLAGDSEIKSVSVEQRFRETDLSLAIRQYERLKTEAFETRLKLDLLGTDEEMTEASRKKRAELLTKRYEILQERAEELRLVALRLGEEITTAKAR